MDDHDRYESNHVAASGELVRGRIVADTVTAEHLAARIVTASTLVGNGGGPQVIA